MKTFTIATVLICGLIAARIPTRPGGDHSRASVNQVQGIYVFTDSRPADPYEYLGSVKSTVTFGGSQYQATRDRLIKRLKNDFPTAQGAILYFTAGAPDRADAIKFQE